MCIQNFIEFEVIMRELRSVFYYLNIVTQQLMWSWAESAIYFWKFLQVTLQLKEILYCSEWAIGLFFHTFSNDKIINNYWRRSSRIWGIIKAEVCVICRSRRLRQITQTEALIIPHILREPNSIIVLLFICICKPVPWRSRPFQPNRKWASRHFNVRRRKNGTPCQNTYET